MSMDEHIYKTAKKRVKAKKDFFNHLSSYVAVGIFFFVLNLVTFDGDIWFFFPLIPWGAGLLIHYFSVQGLPGIASDWEEKELRKEMNKLRRVTQEDQDQYLDPEPLDIDDELELKEFKKLRKEWDDSDFV